MTKNFLYILLITKTLQIFSPSQDHEINSINHFIKEFYDQLNINKKSSIFLIYSEKIGNYQYNKNQKGYKYLFYIDSGHRRRFYIGMNIFPNRFYDKKNMISDFVSSEEISKVLIFLELYIDDIIVKNKYQNLARKFLESEILPEKFKFCKNHQKFDLDVFDFENVKNEFESYDMTQLRNRDKIMKIHKILHKKLGIEDGYGGDNMVKNDILKKVREIEKEEREGNLYEMLQSTNFGFPSVKK